MWLLPIAAFVEALITILVMSSIGLIPPLVIFLVILVAVGALAITRPRPRVFVVGGIVLLTFVGLNVPFAVDGLIHPTGSSHAWTDIIAIVVGAAGAIAGLAAFVETRSGKPVVRAMRGPIGELLLILTIGALVGTTYVSVLGFRALDGTAGLGVDNGVVKAPTRCPSSSMRAERRSPRSRLSCIRARARSTWSTPMPGRIRSTSISTASTCSTPSGPIPRRLSCLTCRRPAPTPTGAQSPDTARAWKGRWS
jgi:hypothetical protein